jgi:Xaa-Pro aminopeptidase
MIDMGCRVNGYCSDITRMIWLGEPAEAKVAELHSVVSAAQEAAIAEVRAGIAAADVDRAARRVISDAGYGELFVHGTGHGVGLEIHEAPAVSGRNDKPLVAGAVITIEPAVYLPGTVGVRLEDMVRVREGGCDRLTTLGTEPMLA